MVLEGSTALRGVVEMGNVLEMNYTGTPIPERFYLITDGGDRNIGHLSMNKVLVGFFRKYDFDEIIAIRTAAGLSFYNPVERMHARGNQGLQGVGMMRSSMTNDLERFLKKCNSNGEVRKACDKEPRLKEALKVSLDSSIELLKEIFSRLSMTRTEFLLYDPSSDEDLNNFTKYYDVFDAEIQELTLKSKLNSFPLFKQFLETHTSLRAYSFHILKCEDETCIFHNPLRGPHPDRFPDPVPVTSDVEGSKYKEGYDPDEQHLLSKLEDVSKQNHNIPFTPTAQTTKNVGFVIKCTSCSKPRLLYSTYKLKENETNSFKRFTNNLIYICGGSFREIEETEGDPNSFIKDKVFVRENISCCSQIEIPYYSVGVFKDVCIHCGCED